MYAYPMDSVVTYNADGTPQFDRAVDSSQLRALYHELMTDGVLLNDGSNLQVSVSSNMDIVVNPGLCNIQGCIKKFTEETPITISSANATMSRIDTVVARLDLNSDYRDIGLFVIQGTPASVPTRPELTRNTSVYEIALADITISANATSLTQANVSDTRLDTNRCGIISCIAEFDTTKLYEQIQADLKQFQESNEADFEQWFEHMKEQLGEDAAGNLQLQIDDHVPKEVPSENGAHGFRYFEGKLQAHIYDEESMTLKWVTVPGSGIDYDGEKSVKGAIDELAVDTVLPRYKKIKLSSSGWYRIAKMECRSESEANGGGNNSCDIEIKRMYNTISPEYKKIKLVSLYENSSFVDEISKSATDNANTITKIRHTVDTTNNTNYIEVYYNANSENNMFITLNNHFNVYVLAWELIEPIATSETVSGITVIGSHEFTLNYDVQTQLDSKLNKSIFSTWPTMTGISTFLNMDASYEIGFASNKVFLVTVSSDYNVSGVYIVQTGTVPNNANAKCTVTTIISSSLYTLTPLTKTTLQLKTSGGYGYVTYMCIGGH